MSHQWIVHHPDHKRYSCTSSLSQSCSALASVKVKQGPRPRRRHDIACSADNSSGMSHSHSDSIPFAFGSVPAPNHQHRLSNGEVVSMHHPPSRLSPPPGTSISNLLTASGIAQGDGRQGSVDEADGSKRKEDTGPKRGYRACVGRLDPGEQS